MFTCKLCENIEYMYINKCVYIIYNIAHLSLVMLIVYVHYCVCSLLCMFIILYTHISVVHDSCDDN